MPVRDARRDLMTEFQLGLLLIGVLAIGGVIVFNRVQERLAAKRAERAFGSQHADVLLGEAPQRTEPTLDSAARKADREPEVSVPALPDEALDYVIALASPRPLPVATFLEYWTPLEHRFAKQVLAAGRDDANRWKRVAHGDPAAYNDYRTALQLVSRAGIVNEGEIIEFRSAVENLAANLGAVAAAPEMKLAMEAARELDQFCADADIQVVLNLVASAGSAFPAAKLAAAISSAGLGRLTEGQHAMRDAQGRILYVVSVTTGERQEEVPKLGISLDVPRTPDVVRTYQSMVRFAHQLAAGLGGSLIDDNGRQLDEPSLAAIGAELESICRGLEGRGIPPGGTLALRLFS
jgi:ZipA, C-terminal FtsZ-binding domain